MKRLNIVIAALSLCLLIPELASANGMSGHLYIGREAVKKLQSSHGVTYRMLSIGTGGHPNYFRTGLLLPDALMGIKDVSDFGHNDVFLNAYMERLVRCKKEHGHFTKGKTDAETLCAMLYAQFFGVVAHVASDIHHDDNFMKDVFDAHKDHPAQCAIFAGNAGDSRPCSSPEDIAAGSDAMSCLLVPKDKSSDNSYTMRGGSPGAQWFTDVAIDFVVYPGIQGYVPNDIVARNYQISNMTTKFGKRVGSRTIKNAVDKYEKDIVDQAAGGTTKGGSQAANVCSWGVDHHIKAPGGLTDTADFVYGVWDEILDLINAGRTPVFEVNNGLNSKKFEVSRGPKF